MNYFLLDLDLKCVAILSTESTSDTAFMVFEDEYCEFNNAPSTLDLTIDFYHKNREHVVEGAYVVFQDDNVGKYKLFQIKQIEEQHAEESYMKIYAEESSFDLIDAILFQQNCVSMSISNIMNIILADTDWEMGAIDNVTVESFEIGSYSTALATLQELAEIAGCYLDFNIDFSPTKGITGRYVDMVEKYDVYNGERLEFGVNVDSISRTIDRTPICTSVLPYGDDDLTINGMVWQDIYEDKRITKPDTHSPYICLKEEYRQEVVKGSDRHIVYALNCSGVKDKTILAKMAYDYLHVHCEPQITYEVSANYLNDKFYHIGEELNIIDSTLGLTLSAIVSEKVTSYCDPSKNQITLINYEVKESNISQKLLDLQNKLTITNIENPIWHLGATEPSAPSSEDKEAVWVDTSNVEITGIVVIKKYDPATGTWIPIQDIINEDVVSNQIENIVVGADNLVNMSDMEEGYLQLDLDDLGAMDATRQEHTSGFIRVDEGDNLILQCWVTLPEDYDPTTEYLWMTAQYYDSAQARVGNRIGGTYTDAETVNGQKYKIVKTVVPTGATFIRVSARLYGDGKLKLEVGTKPTMYTLSSTELQTRLQNAEIATDPTNIISTVLESESYKTVTEDFVVGEQIEDMATNAGVQEQIGAIDHAGKINERIDEMLSDENSALMSTFTTQSSFQQTKDEFLMTFEKAGGINLLKNSLGYEGVASSWQTGSPNLLKNSNVVATNNEYRISHYVPVSPLVAGKTYHVQITLTPASGVTDFKLYSSCGWQELATFTVNGTTKQTFRATFVMGYHSTHLPSDSMTNANLEVYRFPNDGTVTGNSTVHSIKISEGVEQSDAWSDTLITQDEHFVCGYDAECEAINFENSIQFLPYSDDWIRLRQPFSSTVNQHYTLGFYYKLTSGEMVVNCTDDTLNPIKTFTTSTATDGYKFAQIQFTATSSLSNIQFIAKTNTELFITGIMLNFGDRPFSHTFHKGEIANRNITFSQAGIKVIQLDSQGNPKSFTLISNDEFAGYSKNESGGYSKTFYLNEDCTVSRRASMEKELILGKAKWLVLDDDTFCGIALIPSTVNDWQLTEGTE